MTKEQQLIQAAQFGNIQEIKQLVQKGVDIHALDDLALRAAVESGHLQIVKFLVKIGADIHTGDRSLLISAVVNHRLEIIKFLLKNSNNLYSDINISLKWAKQYKHCKIVRYLEAIQSTQKYQRIYY